MNLTIFAHCEKDYPYLPVLPKKGEETTFVEKKPRKYVKPNDFNQRPLLTDMKIS